MNKQIRCPVFDHPQKFDAREYIANSVSPGETLLNFYGRGEMDRYCHKRKVNIFSIDDGRDFNNKVYLKKKMKGKNREYISLRELADRGERQFEVLWPDYCGPVGKEVIKDLEKLPRIMKDKGRLFITFLRARETMCPPGTYRGIIDDVTISWIRDALMVGGVKLGEQIISERYNSIPKYVGRRKNSGSPMTTIGFEYTKI